MNDWTYRCGGGDDARLSSFGATGAASLSSSAGCLTGGASNWIDERLESRRAIGGAAKESFEPGLCDVDSMEARLLAMPVGISEERLGSGDLVRNGNEEDMFGVECSTCGPSRRLNQTRLVCSLLKG